AVATSLRCRARRFAARRTHYCGERDGSPPPSRFARRHRSPSPPGCARDGRHPARRRARPAARPGGGDPGGQPHPPGFRAGVRHPALPLGGRGARARVGSRLRRRVPAPLAGRRRSGGDFRAAAPIRQALRRLGRRGRPRRGAALRSGPGHRRAHHPAPRRHRPLRRRGADLDAAGHAHAGRRTVAVRRPRVLHRRAGCRARRALGSRSRLVADRAVHQRGPLSDRAGDRLGGPAQHVRAAVSAAHMAGPLRPGDGPRLASPPGRGGPARDRRAPGGRGGHRRAAGGVSAAARDRARSARARPPARLWAGRMGGVGSRALRQAHARSRAAGEHGGVRRSRVPALRAVRAGGRGDRRPAAHTARSQLLLRLHHAGLRVPGRRQRPRPGRRRAGPAGQHGSADRLSGAVVDHGRTPGAVRAGSPL
ncbi:MAG: hypothetical protein AVDCRST_MAG69-1996, partial [uncultured Solirubrobacteraceae bacterium]